MSPAELLDRIERLFTARGGAEYHGEPVTQLEHALQAALFAEQDGRPAAWIAAALLHDVGHLLHGHGEDCAADGIDDRHEDLGVRLLAQGFGPEVTEPVRLHVAAKRYLCGADAAYLDRLSPASVQSLALQGGPMPPDERAAFECHPYFQTALAIRGYDDRAKAVGLPTPPLSHFRQYLTASLRSG